MSTSTALTPTVTIATSYQVNSATQISLGYSTALQPDCSQTGANQTATPNPSPSR